MSGLLGLVELIVLVVIGLFTGLVGGMLGVGGSIVMIPAMTEALGPDQHLYQAAAMIVNFFVVVPAVYQHRRARAIDLRTVGRIMPLALVAVLGGVGVSELPIFAHEREAYLRGLFGLFLLGVALTDLHRLFRGSRTGGAPANGPHPLQDLENPGTGTIGWLRAGAVAIPTGLVAGLFGVGGGIMAVPLQRRLLGVPIRTAIANSATIIIATSLIGAISKNYAYMSDHDDSTKSLVLAAVLIPTAIIGSLNGSRLTHRLPLKIVKTAFFLLLLVAAVRLTYKAARSLGRETASVTVRHCPAPPPPGPLKGSAIESEAQRASTFQRGYTDTSYRQDGQATRRINRSRISTSRRRPMSRPSIRRLSTTGVTVAAAFVLATQTGCPGGREFREAALPALETGVNSILDGIVDGIFAAIEPEPPGN